jgi:hypothetical protein
VSRWRRKTFSDFTGALKSGAGKPAPTSTQFSAVTTAANLAAQTAAATQPMPTRPGADQQVSLTLGPVNGLALAPGASTTVAATFSNNGPGSVGKVKLSLSGAPAGWKIAAAGATTAPAIAATTDLTASWKVTAPATAGPQIAQLTATASFTDAATRANAGLTPGGTVTADKLTFTWPNVAAGTADNVLAAGQIIDLAGTAGQTTLGLLGSSSNGISSGTVAIFYTDGTSATGTVSFGDWASGPASGDTTVATMPYRNSSSGTSQSIGMYIYAATVAVDSSKTVESIVLPNVNSTTSGTAMHIFAIALGS